MKVLAKEQINFRSINDLNELVLSKIPSLPEEIDLVVAVPRSGYLVAAMIALNINTRMCSYNEYINGLTPLGGQRTNRLQEDGKQVRNVLIVDDSVSTGWEMKRLKEQVASLNLDDRITFLAAYVSTQGMAMVDIALEKLDYPQMFEWNLYHHPHLKRSCMEMDGVICLKPQAKELATTKAYEAFINNAKARIIPTVEVGFIIADRPERYREQTESWLRKHNVQYGMLIMNPDDSVLTESEDQNRSLTHKINQYSSLDAFLYIGYSKEVASEIFNKTQKAVFCVENHTFINAKVSNTITQIKKIKRRLSFLKRG